MIVLSRLRVVAVLLAVAIVTVTVEGCSRTVSESASAPASTATTDENLNGPYGPRPRNIRLDDVDPCTLLTVGQAQSLELVSPRVGDNARPDIHVCLWNGPSGIYDVSTMTDNDVQDVYIASPDPMISSVDGYPAVLTRSIGSGPDDSCDLFIDVHPNQVLHVGFDGLGFDRRSRAVNCSAVAHMAEIVFANVRAATG